MAGREPKAMIGMKSWSDWSGSRSASRRQPKRSANFVDFFLDPVERRLKLVDMISQTPTQP